MGRLQLQILPRKLIEYSIKDDDYENHCSKYCSSSDDCKSPKCYLCIEYSCSQYLSPPPPLLSNDHSSNPRKFLIITLTIFAVTFVALCCYVFYFKYYLGWRASRRRSAQPQINETHDDFLDEDHGPVVDHHVWYINTVGLQPSVISSITVCRYKKGDGLVEGTECSVCLNEFQEDETLRLLPKCSHAFHIPCIDTWLRSHTNCPLCRAPIVKNDTAGSSSSSSSSQPETNTDDSAANNDTQVQVLQDNEETERDLEGESLERRIGIEEAKRCENSEEELNEIQPIRRSVSLDSLSASKLSQSLANFVIQEETTGNSDAQMERQRDSSIKIVSKRVSRSESLRRFLGSSPIRRSLQIGPASFKRSVSCSGKFLFPRSS